MEPRQDYMLNSLRVCIDRYDDVKMGGRAYSPLQSEVIEFEDFMEMIAQADKLFDEKGTRSLTRTKECLTVKTNVPLL